MKMPLDPSEPMFPVRPNEPACQYYMKHGTCKFGQTCKFNHPPQSQLAGSTLNGNSGLAGPGGRKNDSPQMLWNTAGGDSGVQSLPQRPDEPNCIFFLKNGRCKYGSTCRYHHPLNYHERRHGNADDGRRQQHAQGESIPKIHYVTQLPPGSYQQGHFVVTDGTVAFLTLDGSATPAQVIPVSQGNPDAVLYASNGNRPLGHSRDVVASTSTPSIASSYETAASNMDMMGSHGDSSSSSLWNRPRRNNSSNSLGAYNVQDGNGRQHFVQGGRAVYVQNAEPGTALPRVGSMSSNASENGSVYWDAPQGLNRGGSHVQVTSGTTWRGRRSNSFEHAGQGSSYHNRDDDAHDGSGHYRSQDGQRSTMMRGRPPPGARRRPQHGEVDDGLSMMTSALLTMLDTPEEAAAEHYEGYYDEQSMPSSQMSTPQMRPVDFTIKDHGESPNSPGDARLYHSTSQYPPHPGYYDHANVADDRVLGLMMSDSRSRLKGPYKTSDHQRRQGPADDDFYPWQDHGQMGRPLQENAHSLSVVQQSNSPASPHASSNVGLYLYEACCSSYAQAGHIMFRATVLFPAPLVVELAWFGRYVRATGNFQHAFRSLYFCKRKQGSLESIASAKSPAHRV